MSAGGRPVAGAERADMRGMYGHQHPNGSYPPQAGPPGLMDPRRTPLPHDNGPFGASYPPRAAFDGPMGYGYPGPPPQHGHPGQPPIHMDPYSRPRVVDGTMGYYPPPPPPQSREERHDPAAAHHDGQRRGSVSLPSMGSWAPPADPFSRAGADPHRPYGPGTSPHHMPPGGPAPPQHNPQSWSRSPVLPDKPGINPVQPSAGASKSKKRGKQDSASGSGAPPQSEEEDEAGLVLAGMGLGLTAGEMRARRDSADLPPAPKKVKAEKKEEESPVLVGGKKPEQAKKSCAECRRLKAKCDRVFPCSNCRRRGCAVVCPDGDLSCMQGKRLVLASTEQLHERIAQLETALQVSHAQASATSHPLLGPEYLDGGFAAMPPPPAISAPGTTEGPTPTHSAPHISPPAPISSLDPGSRAHERGSSVASSFQLLTPDGAAGMGSTGRMAVKSLLLNEDVVVAEGKKPDEWASVNAAPAMIVGSVGSSLVDDTSDRHMVCERLGQILAVLPPKEVTVTRSKHFWETSGWYQNILRPEEFDRVYLPACYAPTSSNPLTPHKLACVLMVLTLDTYFDISSEDDRSKTVASYWEATQRCFDLRFGWAASVAGVQALALAALFVGFGWRGALASNFYWLRMMTTGALQLGLHKEPHASLPEEEREFRRRVFHEMYSIDCLISINHGQRTAIPLETIEAAFPKSTTPLAMAKYEYMRLVKNQVIEVGCMPDTNPASPELVDSIWVNMCMFDATSQPNAHCPLVIGQPIPPFTDKPTHLNQMDMIRTTTSMCHFKAQLFLYRPSLRRLVARLRVLSAGQAVVFTDDERRTVERTYQACNSIIACSLYMTRTHPRIAARCWAVWVQTFSATVSIAALAIWCCAPLDAAFLKDAFEQLTEACKMIATSGTKRSLGVQDLMPVLRGLVATRHPELEGRDASTASTNQAGENMLFLLLGGHIDGTDNAPADIAAQATNVAAAQGVQIGVTEEAQTARDIATAKQPTVVGTFDNQAAGLALPPKPTALQSGMPTDAFSFPQTWAEERLTFVHSDSWQPDLSTAQGMLQMDGMANIQQQQQQQSQHFNGGGVGSMGLFGDAQTDYWQMGNPELWAKIQTFYEPATAFWQGGVEWQMPGMA